MYGMCKAGHRWGARKGKGKITHLYSCRRSVATDQEAGSWIYHRRTKMLPFVPARNRAEIFRIAIAENPHYSDSLSSSVLARVHADATNSKLPIVAHLHLPAAPMNAGNHSYRGARTAGRSYSGIWMQPSEIGFVAKCTAVSGCRAGSNPHHTEVEVE